MDDDDDSVGDNWKLMELLVTSQAIVRYTTSQTLSKWRIMKGRIVADGVVVAWLHVLCWIHSDILYWTTILPHLRGRHRGSCSRLCL